jgi:hypothetical protein
LGLRVSPQGIVAPRRWSLLGPLLLLWRRRIQMGDAKSVLAKPKNMWGEQVVLEPFDGHKQLLFFPNREQKLAFFKAVQENNRMLPIYRAE